MYEEEEEMGERVGLIVSETTADVELTRSKSWVFKRLKSEAAV